MIAQITEWHKRARPAPDHKAFCVQLGCHLEEIAEMLVVLKATNPNDELDVGQTEFDVMGLAEGLKSGRIEVDVTNRGEFLDALADQVVTLAGVAHCANMALPEAVRRVNESNWSKYVDGKPVFNKQGKIAKGPDYEPPNLAGLY